MDHMDVTKLLWWQDLHSSGRMRDALQPVSSDGHGRYTCGACGHAWSAGSIYLWWPIRLRWSGPFPGQRSPWFTWHGFEVGAVGVERLVYGWTFHLGRLKVIFGGPS